MYFNDFKTPTQVQDLITRYKAGTLTAWKCVRGVGYYEKYKNLIGVDLRCCRHPSENLTSYGKHVLG